MRYTADPITEFRIDQFGKRTGRTNTNSAATLIEIGWKAWTRELERGVLPPALFKQIDDARGGDKHTVMSTRLPDAVADQIKARAAAENRSPSSFIANALAEHVQK